MRPQVDEECQDDPEPGPAADPIAKRIDDDIGQGGDRQEDDPKQRQEPAALESTRHQRRRQPDNEQPDTGEKRNNTPHVGVITSLEVEDASPTSAALQALQRWVEMIAEQEMDKIAAKCAL